jgi:hypothetical protein
MKKVENFKKALNQCPKYEVGNHQLGGWIEVKPVLWIAYSNQKIY